VELLTADQASNSSRSGFIRFFTILQVPSQCSHLAPQPVQYWVITSVSPFPESQPRDLFIVSAGVWHVGKFMHRTLTSWIQAKALSETTETEDQLQRTYVGGFFLGLGSGLSLSAIFIALE
jgi:hypothetical protein